MRLFTLATLVLLLVAAPPATAQSSATSDASDGYENFRAAVYTRVYEVQKMADPEWLRDTFEQISRHVDVGKVYLETHRDTIIADAATIEQAQAFFESRGVEVGGGITYTISEANRFETFCFSNAEHRAYVREVAEFTARHFDDFILDDFFFTSCKSEGEIEARGDRSWTEYRLDLLDRAAHELVLEPARAVNPDVKVIIKYPNWYDHFQALGFNLETQPDAFAGVYTGTETRNAVRSAQHLQPYESYQIFRYFENLAPGRNLGGWVDTGGMRYADRYAEQLWLTLFAKAPEMTLFDWRQMLYPLTEEHRAPWQDRPNSLDFDAMVAPFRQDDGTLPDQIRALAAGTALAEVDPVLGFLGEPAGVASYKPYHSTGEDFLHNFLGMIGIPIDLRAEFPAEEPTILLTAAAAHDEAIVDRIEGQLLDGKDVVITSGLLDALEDRGIQQIAEIEVTDRKAYVDSFLVGREVVHGDEPILIPQLHYFTNDSWELIGALDGPNGWPLLHDADYAGGQLYVLTIPDNFADLYHLPAEVLTRIKQTVMQDQGVRIDGPSEIALFAYDNDTFVVHSFRDTPTDIRIVTDGRSTGLRDVQTDGVLNGTPVPASDGWRPSLDEGRVTFETTIEPHSFRVFTVE